MPNIKDLTFLKLGFLSYNTNALLVWLSGPLHDTLKELVQKKKKNADTPATAMAVSNKFLCL